ncbi:MAG: transporter substrate-binding domain-containing protein [Sulfitobacter sp.]|nr:transporter substrate-binding domain-containing protein [Sulfitobacter sp.]
MVTPLRLAFLNLRADIGAGPVAAGAFWMRVVVFALFCMVGFGASPAQASDRQLSLAAAPYPPLTTVAKDGYLDRIVQEAFARADIELTYQATSPGRGLYGSLTGEFDGYFATPDLQGTALAALVRVPEVIHAGKSGGVYLRDDITMMDKEYLKPYRVGYVKGWKQVKDMLKDVPDLYAAESSSHLMEMLVRDRVDVAYMFFLQARYQAQRQEVSGLKFSDHTFVTELFIHLSPEHADLADDLAVAIRSMKADGTLEDIMAPAMMKWGPK